MPSCQVQIRKGLNQLKNLLKNGPGAKKVNLSAPKLISAHGVKVVNSHGRTLPDKPLPPLPQALPSLRDFYANTNVPTDNSGGSVAPDPYANNRDGASAAVNLDQAINQSFMAEESGSPAESLGNGPLAIEEDLQLYREFADWETKAMLAFNTVDSSGFRKLQGKPYEMEKLVPGHKSGYLMSLLLKYYSDNFERVQSKVTFTEFITHLSEADILRIWNPFDDNVQEYVRRFKQGVRYLTAEKRVKYNVGYKNGKLYWAKWADEQPLDTTIPKFFKRKHEEFSRFAGKDDLAIWVLSKEEKLYTHAAKLHRFHHSSFTSGDNIICAGDWEVKDGKIAWISGSSGHYQPSFANLREGMKVLQKAYGIGPLTYQVKLFHGKDVWTRKSELFPAYLVMKNTADFQERGFIVG
jgi:hypothetical protein